jgi:hypothetical protein
LRPGGERDGDVLGCEKPEERDRRVVGPGDALLAARREERGQSRRQREERQQDQQPEATGWARRAGRDAGKAQDLQQEWSRMLDERKNFIEDAARKANVPVTDPNEWVLDDKGQRYVQARRAPAAPQP